MSYKLTTFLISTGFVSPINL